MPKRNIDPETKKQYNKLYRAKKKQEKDREVTKIPEEEPKEETEVVEEEPEEPEETITLDKETYNYLVSFISKQKPEEQPVTPQETQVSTVAPAQTSDNGFFFACKRQAISTIASMTTTAVLGMVFAGLTSLVTYKMPLTQTPISIKSLPKSKVMESRPEDFSSTNIMQLP
jgi:hypothetical protein